MGYYTQFSLDFEAPTKKSRDEVISYFEANRDNMECYAWREKAYGTDDCKWYTYDDDMHALSKLFPNVLFKLSGVGEDHSDMWCAYYKVGKVQFERAQIVYAEFDESKLK
ncbi:hypothetical protein CMI47_13070 [Candidatus Pacearchaeota archaeon]|nr:hypothetical protein [Candidatus Pacearchaeota archaeon]|tara:strand:+ start:23905 stop:24234 length:330 start_codon:yes stop_codon:yes gene_type:complete